MVTNSKRGAGSGLVIVLLVLVMGLQLAIPDRACSNGVPEVLGKSYGDWSEAWWQWAVKEPIPSNPLLDSTGAFAGANQKGQVWFLAGFSGSSTVPIVRSVDIPKDNYIFFPIVNSVDVNGNPAIPIDTEEYARTVYLDGFITLFSNLVCTLDNVPVVFNPDTPIVRSQSSTFKITLGPNNIFGAPVGEYPLSWSDGYWVMLPPLTPGDYVLHFYAHVDDSIFGAVTQDITYNIMVIPLPGTILLLGTGLLGLFGFGMRRSV
jgi:hypothetical protein